MRNDKISTMTQERFFELVYAWKDGDLTGDELYQRVFVLSNVVGQSEQFYCSSYKDGEWRCKTQCLECTGVEEQAKQ